ncbi:MAG: IS21 family transposase [Planctomycetota bacterium]
MRQIRNVLRLKFERGLSHREIARALGIGVGTVSEYVRKATEAGLGWPLAEELDDTALEGRVFGRRAASAGERPLPDFAGIHQELRRKGVTLQLLWVEYLEAHPGGYRYSQFCELYRRFRKKLSPSMRQIHRAGEKAFVDFAGQKIEWVDPRTGEVQSCELFVGVLGASSFIYAEATPDQTLPSWIAAHVRMLETFGGAPQIITPDNLKSGVTRPCRYEPVVNRTYEEMARHYGAVVIPARPARPKDKATAEVSVQIAERWILAALRNRTFFSFAELNRTIRERCRLINDRPMQRLGVSRRELLERLDRPALQPLPSSRFEPATWSEGTVSIDYHVGVARNFYSVPYQLIGERVEARLTATMVEIFYKSKRIASHRRLHGRGKYATNPDHMPRSHRAHAEWTPSRLIAWAGKTGPATAHMVTEILKRRPHPEQGYRACLGIMRLEKAHSTERLEAACRRAARLRAFSYRTVKNILSAGTDRLPLERDSSPTPAPPRHPNIRGGAYYARKEVSPC